MHSESLKGKTIVITRSESQQAEARGLFESIGARVLDLPALVIGPPDDLAPLDNALSDLNSFNWIIFSSVNGVQAVEQRLKLIDSSLLSKPKVLKIAAVGRKTAKYLAHIGITCDFVPPEFVADSLIKFFPVPFNDLRFLIPRVQTGGRTILAKAFREAGGYVVEVPAYESKCPQDFPSETAIALKNMEVDAIVFTSGKTAAHSAELMSKYFGEEWQKIIFNVKLISIGPQTSNSCEKYFNRVDQEALQHDLDGLVSACIQSVCRN